MSHQSALIAEDIEGYLKAQEEKSLLRFITCGSVDDGKSTLIGRLLWDSKLIFEDQLAALEADSRRIGTQGGAIDYALLLDGLQAEREQGITIDVAYRFFSTDRRKFIVADTPGHEQYTRNMVTGASTAQVAVILVDARKGVLTQTRRHSYLVSLVGIRHVVLAVNKMDLVDFSRERFETIRSEYEAFAAALGFEKITPIPISALDGDNVIEPSSRTPWYQGPPLLEHLETVPVARDAAGAPFRMRVQWVNRPDLDFRGFCGTIASGQVGPGDEVVVASSGQKSRVARIVTLDGDLPRAVAGQAVTLTLADEIDVSRGDTFASPADRPYHADRLEAKIVWLHEDALRPGGSYLLKAGSAMATVRVEELAFKVNVNTLSQEAGETLGLNEVGVCRLAADRPLAFDSYRENRSTGAFILIDRLSNATVGAGMIHQPVRQGGDASGTGPLDPGQRAGQKGQRARVLWFNAPAGPAAAALAARVETKLFALGRHTCHIDGERLRKGLNADLAAAADRREETRRLAEVARLGTEAGLEVLVSTGGLAAEDLFRAREILAGSEIVEIGVGPASPRTTSAESTGVQSTEPDRRRLTVDADDDAETAAARIVRELCD